MAEDDCADAESTTSRAGEGGLGIHFRRGSLQPGADEESDGQFSWCRMRQGRSVPERGTNRENGPQLQALIPRLCILEATHIVFGIMRVADLAETAHFSAAC